jgi:hypothetical protein
MPKDLK